MHKFHYGTGPITTVILIKDNHVKEDQIRKYYIEPLVERGLSQDNVAVYGLLYEAGKIKADLGKNYLRMLLPQLEALPDLKYLVVADSHYFKFITKQTKISNCYGELVPGTLEGYENYQVSGIPNYMSLVYTPDNQTYIDLGLNAITQFKKTDIIHSARYISDRQEAIEFLDSLHQYDLLTSDIETTGLPLGIDIHTIAFAWDQHNGGVIDVIETGEDILLDFFRSYKGNFIFHNALFDCKHIIFNLFMKKQFDLEMMHEGLQLFERVEDSRIYVYLAKNSTAETQLGLKPNSLEFAGNYGLDVTDITKIPRADLLEYNLKDVLCTWYVYDKYKAIVEKEGLMEPYTKIFQPSIKLLMKMMLVGLPIDLNQVDVVANELQDKYNNHLSEIAKFPEIQEFNHNLRLSTMKAANAKLKRKVKPFSDFMNVEFNPKSNNNLRELIYTQFGYDAIDLTDTKQPATGTKTIEKLLNIITIESHKDLLNHVIGVSQTSKILNTFIKAFKTYSFDGFLHGDLKLGGTQSGRLSSSNPNLQNLPSNSIYGKAIKSCFIAPDGWLWAGADFSSLEDRINAILTGDPNKIKVYSDGYDGHSLRAFSYFRDQMPDIVDTVESINSIENDYPDLRQKSKGPTFALTYGGTAYTLHKNAGIPMKEAEEIEKRYHELYKESDKFTQDNINFASVSGYMECAFGLRIKCPVIQKTIMNTTKTPYAAIAEARSANNAVTQSWGMLINRALIATNKLIEESEFKYDILPINTIHDAGYFMVKNKPEAIKFLNDTLINEMRWNDHPAIYSEDVPMEADLELGKSWDKQRKLKNEASLDEIKEFTEML